jgi:hypothetical protein
LNSHSTIAITRGFQAQVWVGTVWISWVQIIGINEMFPIFVPLICIILFIFNFQVTTTKEIEMSKSGTSSTSSASSKGSSSSSSSSSADPVIEL